MTLIVQTYATILSSKFQNRWGDAVEKVDAVQVEVGVAVVDVVGDQLTGVRLRGGEELGER